MLAICSQCMDYGARVTADLFGDDTTIDGSVGFWTNEAVDFGALVPWAQDLKPSDVRIVAIFADEPTALNVYAMTDAKVSDGTVVNRGTHVIGAMPANASDIMMHPASWRMTIGYTKSDSEPTPAGVTFVFRKLCKDCRECRA